MHRKVEVKNKELFTKIKELSNPSKFRILEIIENGKMSVTLLAKKVNLAFNKCSNYCSQMEKVNILTKEKKGKNVFVKSRLEIKELEKVFR